jgi:hypothetical protein
MHENRGRPGGSQQATRHGRVCGRVPEWSPRRVSGAGPIPAALRTHLMTPLFLIVLSRLNVCLI